MKPHLLFLRSCSALLSAALFFSACTLPAYAEETPEPPHYLALGDSISTGYRLGGGHFETEGFTNILSDTNGYLVTNASIDGNTVSGILSQLENGSLNDAISSADIITITCGGNDMLEFLYTFFSEQLEDTQQYINGILNGILGELDLPPSSAPETEPEEEILPEEEAAAVPEDAEETPAASPSLDEAYNLLNNFISGINQSLHYIENARENASLWERLLFIAYEELIDYTLDTAASLLIDVTESDSYHKAVSEYITDLNRVISYIRSLNRDVPIILTTQYNPYHWFTSPAHEVIERFIDAGICVLNEAIVRNAPIGGYWVTDVYSAFDNSEANLCNANEAPLEMDVHPNKDGHAVIASCIQKTIEETKINSIN
ncbi:MAG: hypothetical protein E7579_08595 [Ruminococcaceae bacterium]|nr:hypothetical protein [Oscillospiraceae bacterium]